MPPRSLALMMPAVTVAFRPNGLPIASTQSPTCTPSELPSLANGKFFGSINLDHRQVGVLIHAHNLRRVLGGIAVQLHLNLGGLFDHVIVRQDVPALVHDHAGAEAALRLGLRIGPAVKKVEEKIFAGIIRVHRSQPRCFFGLAVDHLGGGDIHHRRLYARDNCGKTELDEGMGSGSASGVAFVPANENAFMAETLPEITVPIRMPTTSVAATNPATSDLATPRVQSTIISYVIHLPAPFRYRATQCTWESITSAIATGVSLPVRCAMDNWPLAGCGEVRLYSC